MDFATRARIERHGERIAELEAHVALLTEIAQVLLDRRRGRPTMVEQEKLDGLKEILTHGPSNGH